MLTRLRLEDLHLTALITAPWIIDIWNLGQQNKTFEALALLLITIAHAEKSSTNPSAIGLAFGYPLKNEPPHRKA
ncbi:hypothetical protein IL306_007467 [Fusarium sp. DS 682]|nr:hypothetical protein IL306_007467 [Fusarium sp. DS 682]